MDPSERIRRERTRQHAPPTAVRCRRGDTASPVRPSDLFIYSGRPSTDWFIYASAVRWRALGAVPERRAASEASRPARGPARTHVRGMSSAGSEHRERPSSAVGWGGVWLAEAVAVLCLAAAVRCRAVRPGGLDSRGVRGSGCIYTLYILSRYSGVPGVFIPYRCYRSPQSPQRFINTAASLAASRRLRRRECENENHRPKSRPP